MPSKDAKHRNGPPLAANKLHSVSAKWSYQSATPKKTTYDITLPSSRVRIILAQYIRMIKIMKSKKQWCPFSYFFI
jgi:hypothetical protein